MVFQFLRVPEKPLAIQIMFPKRNAAPLYAFITS